MEWQTKIDELFRFRLKKAIQLNGLVYIGIVGINFLLGVHYNADPLFILVMAFGMATFFVLADLIKMTVIGLYLNKRAPHVGLYEKGVQLNYRLFVPYSEIEAIKVQTSRSRLFGEHHYLKLKNERKLFLSSFSLILAGGDPSDFVNVLGEEGRWVLNERILGTDGGEGAPRLIIYGPTR